MIPLFSHIYSSDLRTLRIRAFHCLVDDGMSYSAPATKKPRLESYTEAALHTKLGRLTREVDSLLSNVEVLLSNPPPPQPPLQPLLTPAIPSSTTTTSGIYPKTEGVNHQHVKNSSSNNATVCYSSVASKSVPDRHDQCVVNDGGRGGGEQHSAVPKAEVKSPLASVSDVTATVAKRGPREFSTPDFLLRDLGVTCTTTSVPGVGTAGLLRPADSLASSCDPPNRSVFAAPHSLGVSASLPFTVIDVSEQTVFEDVYKQWRSQRSFSWSILYSSTLIKVPLQADQDTTDEAEIAFLPNAFSFEGICICWDVSKVFWIPLPSYSEIFHSRMKAVRLMMTSGASKILYDMKAQLKLFKKYNIEVAPPLQDPKIASWLLYMGETRELTLQQIAQKYTGSVVTTSPAFTQLDWCCLKAFQSFSVMVPLLTELKSSNLEELFRKVEMPIVPLLATMEYVGIGFKNKECVAQRDIVQKRLTELEETAYVLAGKKFLLTSPKEVSEVLFIDLQLGHVNTSKKGFKTTNDKVLEQLAPLHPLPRLMRQHRKLTHLLTNQMDTLHKYSFKSPEFNMHRIYCTFLHTAVPTGRLATKDPNLQSTVNEVELIEDDAGTGPPVKINIRSAFIAMPGFVLVSADYCQLEVRLMAHFSKDPLLLEILHNGQDVFKSIAAQWLGKAMDHVSSLDRQQSKQLCYGILYGMGATALSHTLHVSKEEAQASLQSFKTKFVGIDDFLKRTIRQCKEDGYVKTIAGRRRNLPEIFSHDSGKLKRAERQAVNTICQGSAADLVKYAMVTVDNNLQSMGFRDTTRLILEMHDELVYEVAEQNVPPVAALIKKSMESAITLSVPFPVVVKCGSSWGRLEPCKL
ncbi:DNA polymerase theta [Pelomyxa schiedti]|nr:DNA polymerase theta [Pelomyxa schiedti]